MKNLLELNEVTKFYPSFKLDHVSFDVPNGTIVGFIGRNGAGKTTTLKGIMNLIHFDYGTVTCFEKDMKEHELDIKQDIGFSLSELNYYPNRTIAQIADVTSKFYKEFDMSKFNRLCEMFNLDKNKKLEELSSGMKVKYSLAIALSHNAKLLILDEPTSGLDPVSRNEILDIFESIVKKEDRAILFSTHITSDLDKVATHIVYIQKGKIVYKGTKKDFINEYTLIKGNKDEINTNKSYLLGYKIHGNEYDGLVLTSNISKVKYTSKKEPDLEEIMVNLERGVEDEEFDL